MSPLLTEKFLNGKMVQTMFDAYGNRVWSAPVNKYDNMVRGHAEIITSDSLPIEIIENIENKKNNKDVTKKNINCDMVNHPSHYCTGSFECIDVMVETQGIEAVKNFCLCNAFKYLYRHNGKNGIEDIKKSKWYLDKYIELNEKEAKNE